MISLHTVFYSGLMSCLLFSAADATAQADASDIEAICSRVMHTPIPREDFPDPATAQSLDGCHSVALYYGIGMLPEPVRARQCAWLERDDESEAVGYFSGTGMLMTIYANGVGTQRNLDLATRFACEIGGAPMELQGRVIHLQGLKVAQHENTDFHFCDHITSGYAMGLCAGLEAQVADALREQALYTLIDGWSEGERLAFIPLREVANDYFETSARREVDLSGTGRAAFVIESRRALEESFLDMLEALEAGQVPGYSAAELQAVDADMNRAYRALLADKSDNERVSYGTVTAGGVRAAQRAWLEYRDAWLEFAQVKYPDVDTDGLRAWLTKARIPVMGRGAFFSQTH